MTPTINIKRLNKLNFLYKLEKKIGKYAVPNLTRYIIIAFVIGYLLMIFAPQIVVNLLFDGMSIVEGHQYWRIFTWIFFPPDSISFFTLIILFCYYSIGNAIERAVGTFLYNVYTFGGYIITSISVTVASYISYNLGMLVHAVNITYYMVISIFLMYAYIYQDAVMLLFMIFPFKAKWLAYIDLILLAYEFIYTTLIGRVTIVACLLNFAVFYLINERYKKKGYRNSAYMKRKSASNRKKTKFTVVEGGMSGNEHRKTTPQNITRHKCAICGRSERDGEELEFRFCSKCNGNYEYCSEHLYTHEHVK